MTCLRELPFNLPGHIFGGVMPFGLFDPSRECFSEFRPKGIQVIVLLAENEECLRITGRNLVNFYKKEGYEVIHLPIPDAGVPSIENLEHASTLVIEHANRGRNILIHCHAGVGRTGVFMVHLAKIVFGFSGEQAIQWVKRYISMIESEEQRRFILEDENQGQGISK